jgi:hypothetical protein
MCSTSPVNFSRTAGVERPVCNRYWSFLQEALRCCISSVRESWKFSVENHVFPATVTNPVTNPLILRISHAIQEFEMDSIDAVGTVLCGGLVEFFQHLSSCLSYLKK